MRKSAVYLSVVFACQALLLGSACFAESDLDKSLDKLLGSPAPVAGSDSAAGSSNTTDAQAQPEKAKPAKEKKHKEKKEKQDESASWSTADVPKVDPKKLEQSLDKLLGPSSTPGISSPPTASSDNAAPSTDNAAPSTDAAATSTSGADTAASSPPFSSDSNSDTMAGPPAQSSGGGDTDKTLDGGDYAHYTEAQLKAGELNNQAIAQLNAKQFQQAVDLLRQALILWPQYEQGKNNLRVAYYNWAVELSNNGHWTAAMPHAEKAYQLMNELHRDDPDVKSLYEECKKAVAEQQHHK